MNSTSRKLPKLSQKDYVILKKLRRDFPREFYSNKTKFFFNEMKRYVFESRVWRLSIMGETRGGKSEVGSTCCFCYVELFNLALKNGVYDSLDVWEYLRKQPLNFSEYHNNGYPKYVYASQSDYIYKFREQNKRSEMKFGQIHQIDEDKEKTGGIGSYSEILEIQNINNICAKFMQSEVWITPTKLLTRNCPYGLYVYQKNYKEKVNWCLLYKVDMQTGGGANYTFLGWVKVPLHNDEEFRKNYNEMKNDWIKKEIEGGGDTRINERKKIAEQLANDEIFSARSPTGKRFVLSKTQQLAQLENWILEGKCQRFNEVEMYRIIDDARYMVEKEQIKEEIKQHKREEKKKKKKKNVKKKSKV